MPQFSKQTVSAKSVRGNSVCVLSSVLNVSAVWWWQELSVFKFEEMSTVDKLHSSACNISITCKWWLMFFSGVFIVVYDADDVFMKKDGI